MMDRRHFLSLAAAWAAPANAAEGEALLYPAPQPKGEGYNGIWYFNQPSNDRYRYKYSGGFRHLPAAARADRLLREGSRTRRSSATAERCTG